LLGSVCDLPPSVYATAAGKLYALSLHDALPIYAITQADIDAGEVLNQATATGIAPDQSTVTDLSGSTIETDDVTVIELCQNPAIDLKRTRLNYSDKKNEYADFC